MNTYNGNKLKAYNGDGPYIFISYSHADRDRVYPYIEELQKNYNVWYDEGIEYTGEWAEILAERILNCSVFLFFVSENSTQSKYCKGEIYYAFDNDKVFVNILLDDFVFPNWFSMQFKIFQMCNAFSFSLYKDVVNDLERKCSALLKIKKNEPVPPEPEDNSFEEILLFLRKNSSKNVDIIKRNEINKKINIIKEEIDIRIGSFFSSNISPIENYGVITDSICFEYKNRNRTDKPYSISIKFCKDINASRQDAVLKVLLDLDESRINGNSDVIEMFNKSIFYSNPSNYCRYQMNNGEYVSLDTAKLFYNQYSRRYKITSNYIIETSGRKDNEVVDDIVKAFNTLIPVYNSIGKNKPPVIGEDDLVVNNMYKDILDFLANNAGRRYDKNDVNLGDLGRKMYQNCKNLADIVTYRNRDFICNTISKWQNSGYICKYFWLEFRNKDYSYKPYSISFAFCFLSDIVSSNGIRLKVYTEISEKELENSYSRGRDIEKFNNAILKSQVQRTCSYELNNKGSYTPQDIYSFVSQNRYTKINTCITIDVNKPEKEVTEDILNAFNALRERYFAIFK